MRTDLRQIAVIFFLICLPFGIVAAQDITVDADTTWEPGTYTYDNVVITGGATLTFNGAVTLNCANLTINTGSSISAEGKGYGSEGGAGAGS